MLRGLARRGELPAVKLRDDWWFDREDLLDWATGHDVAIAYDLLPSMRIKVATSEFARWLQRGGVFVDVEATDIDSLLFAIVTRLPIDDDDDRELVLEALRTRERSAASSVGDGIAIPHLHDPLVVLHDEPMLSVFWPSKPIDFGAFDGKAVHTFFCLLSPSIRVHQHVLAQLARALHDPVFRAAVERRDGEALLAAAGRIGGHRGQ